MRVVILGVLAPSQPFAEDEQIWRINGGPEIGRVPDVFFQLHGLGHIREKHGEKFIATLQSIARYVPRLYMTAAHPEIQGSLRLPVDELRSEFGDYFTGSFAYAIALAIREGATEIRLDGIDFLLAGVEFLRGAEEMWAVPCIEYFLGIARGRGIKVTVPEGKGIFGPGRWGPRYGYEGAGSE